MNSNVVGDCKPHQIVFTRISNYNYIIERFKNTGKKVKIGDLKFPYSNIFGEQWF